MIAPTTPEGVLRFDLTIAVSMDEMQHWPPACVRAFFDGIARAHEAAKFAREALNAKKLPGKSPGAV